MEIYNFFNNNMQKKNHKLKLFDLKNVSDIFWSKPVLTGAYFLSTVNMEILYLLSSWW